VADDSASATRTAVETVRRHCRRGSGAGAPVAIRLCVLTMALA
jgi:hypothetical protein